MGKINGIQIAPDTISKKTLVQLNSVYQKINTDLKQDAEVATNKFNEFTGKNISTKQFSLVTGGLAAIGLYYLLDEDDGGCKDPLVNLSINVAAVAEASGTATITATITDNAAQNITIPLTVSGSATSGSDYQAISSVTIASGSKTGTATFTPINDSHYDAVSNEIAIFNIGNNGQGFCIGETKSVTVAIVDDETAPTLSLASDASSIAEDAASASSPSSSSSSSSSSASSASPALALYVSNNLNNQSGRLSLNQSGLVTSSSFGSAFAAGLSNEIGYFYDILNGGFRFNFSNLFHETSPKHIDMINALVADINRLSFSLDIDDTKNYSYAFSNVFGKVGNKEVGQLGFSLESTSAPIRHFNQINNGSSFYLASFENPFTDNSKIGFGINAQYQFDDTAVLIGYHNNEIRLSNNLEDINQVETFAISFTQQNDYFDNITILTGLMIEEDTLLDSKGSGALGFHGTNPHSLFAGVNFEKVISNDVSVKFVSTVGYSTLDTPVHSLIGEVSPITSSSFNLILNKYGVMHDKDRLSISIGQPNRVETGTMTFRIPELADSEGNLTYANREIDLNPSGRQLDFGIDYVTKLDNDLILGFKHTLSKDFNHIDSSALNNTVTFTAKIDF